MQRPEAYMSSILQRSQNPYGSLPGPAKAPALRKRRTNIVALMFSLLVPWALFALIFAALSFSLHYRHSSLCWFLVGISGLFVAVCGSMAALALRRRWVGDPVAEPTWYLFIFATSFLAWVLAIALGCSNFASNMRPYYDVANLNVYPGVDPSKVGGQQVMDAGRIMFTRDSKVDVSRSSGFRSSDTYCVAPIVSTKAQLASYDFWVVGVNCCSPGQADYHCGAYNSPSAHGGIRLMNDGQRAFFRLAVEEAEVEFKIRAPHPLFFEWSEDPIAQVNELRDDGFKNYLLGVLCFFAFQLFMTVAASVGFAKFASN